MEMNKSNKTFTDVVSVLQKSRICSPRPRTELTCSWYLYNLKSFLFSQNSDPQLLNLQIKPQTNEPLWVWINARQPAANVEQHRTLKNHVLHCLDKVLFSLYCPGGYNDLDTSISEPQKEVMWTSFMTHNLTTQLPWNEKLVASTKGIIFAPLQFKFLYTFSIFGS